MAWLGLEHTSFDALPALLSRLPKLYWLSLFLAFRFTLSLSLARLLAGVPIPAAGSLSHPHKLNYTFHTEHDF